MSLINKIADLKSEALSFGDYITAEQCQAALDGDPQAMIDVQEYLGYVAGNAEFDKASEWERRERLERIETAERNKTFLEGSEYWYDVVTREHDSKVGII